MSPPFERPDRARLSQHKEMKMTRKLATAAALAFLLAAPAFAADTYAVDRNHSEVSFQIRHLVTNVRGRFNDFSGTVQLDPADMAKSSVEFTIKADSIDTDTPNRDKDLRSPNFFDVEKYPEISFKSDSIKATGKDQYDVAGTLTMHGVSKQVTLPVSFLGTIKDPWGNQRAGFEIATTLDRKDYGINWNKTLDNGGFLLGDDVRVAINLETVLQKPATGK
jgi:polyisoprenoid-binding protein YceI